MKRLLAPKPHIQSEVADHSIATKETLETHKEKNLADSIVSHPWFLLMIIILTAFAFIFTGWLIFKIPDFDLAYLIYQGVLVNPYLVIGYCIIFRKFKNYHNDIL